jgi:hypothetical protein
LPIMLKYILHLRGLPEDATIPSRGYTTSPGRVTHYYYYFGLTT